MENYKYSLDKSSKKFVCPQCTKKTFVRYIDNDTGNYLNDDFGRCDREQKCYYHNAPPKGKKAFLIDYMGLKSISDKAFRLTDLNGIISFVPKSQILEHKNKSCFITELFLKDSKLNYINNEVKYFNPNNEVIVNEIRTVPKSAPIEPSFFKLELLNDMFIENEQIDNLTEFLKIHFSHDKVLKAVKDYLITGTNIRWNNTTVFWQINQKEQIQGAKLMLYDRFTGKRIKKPYNHIDWLHKHTKEPNFNLCQCLFGLHLVNEYPQKSIGIVESEKTAIVMSIFLPDFIWLATGSMGNFKYDLLKPIKNRQIIAFPDKGIYNEWLNKATELNANYFKITISDLIENTDFDNGFDLADLYFLNQN